MKKMHFVHMFDVHSTAVCRLAALGPRLDVGPLYHTVTVTMGKQSFYQKGLMISCNVYMYKNRIRRDQQQQIVESHRAKSKIFPAFRVLRFSRFVEM